MSSSKAPIIIIKKVKKGGHGGHHGGAWKVAYADFVTAMMAFFLLMWLLNATTEEQRRGISNYFGPVGNAMGAGGSGGILGGVSLEKEGSFQEARSSSPIDQRHIKNDALAKEETQGEDDDEGRDGNQGTESGKFDQTQAQKIVEQYEHEKFKEVEAQLRQALQELPDIKELAQNLIIDETPEGLRIQIVDQQKLSMFPNGSADMYPYTEKLLSHVAKVVEKLPNKISITGHTDSKQYSEKSKYSNWELSSDRANATRRILLEHQLNPQRLLYVAGRADTEPLNNTNMLSDQNRRISIVLHRNTPLTPSK